MCKLENIKILANFQTVRLRYQIAWRGPSASESRFGAQFNFLGKVLKSHQMAHGKLPEVPWDGFTDFY